MQTIEQKTIEYLLKRVQELENENQQLKNKIHEDFVIKINKQIPAISEELTEKFKNEWNRTSTFKGKEQTHQPNIIFSDKEPPVTQEQLTIKEINQKVTETLTPFLEKEDLEDLLENFDHDVYLADKDWTPYGLITYCFDHNDSKKGLEYWGSIATVVFHKTN